MLEVKHLTVRSKEGRPLVQDVSFTLTPGKPMGLTGASGSGKTTIIKAVIGLCGIKPSTVPQYSRRFRAGSPSRDCPSRRISPDSMAQP